MQNTVTIERFRKNFWGTFWTLAALPWLALSLLASPVLADDDDDDDDKRPKIHKVDCDKKGKTIQKKLDKAKSGKTVLVKGNCVENVTIRKDGIRLIAHSSGASITAATNDFATIRVRGQRAAITGFTIVGGRIGIQLLVGASATILSNDISGATSTSGILLTQNTYGQIGNSDPASGNTIHNNATSGINIRLGSSGDVFNNHIHSNPTGISVNANGAVDMSDNLIEDNTNRGLSVSSNGSANMSTVPATAGGPNIFNRNGIGVRCGLGGALTGNPQTFGVGADANGMNTETFGSCPVSSGLGF
jgi:hypothetical protein